MKKILFLGIFACSFVSFSQKVDLDRFYFNVSYQRLPAVVVPFEQRTFSTTILTDGPISQQFENPTVLNNQLSVQGWKKVTENATVNAVLNLADFYEEKKELQSRKVETKDSNGNVTSSYLMYTMVTSYKGTAFANVTGPKVVKADTKEKPTAATNRFVKNTDTETAAAPATTSDAPATTTESFKYDFSTTLTFSSQESKSPDELEKDYRSRKGVNLNNKLREFVAGAMKGLIDNLDFTYGFSTISHNDKLWIIDSEEEEGAIQKEAIEAVKMIFGGMKADVPIDKITSDLQPLIEYFDSLKTKYTANNKGCKKIRYSAYYNLGQIYYYLDQPEKTIKEAEGLIANDYDKSDGKQLIKAAEVVIAAFERTKLRSRHNPTLK